MQNGSCSFLSISIRITPYVCNHEKLMIFTPSRELFYFVNILCVIIFCFQSHLKADLHGGVRQAIKISLFLPPPSSASLQRNYFNGSCDQVVWHSSSHDDDLQWKCLARKNFWYGVNYKSFIVFKAFSCESFVYALVWDEEIKMGRLHVHYYGINYIRRA